MVWAFDTKCPTPAAKLVLIKLADHANDEGECWPSQGRIADDCGLTRQWVNQQIKVLSEMGLIEARQRIDEHGQHANRYFLRCQLSRHPVSTELTPPLSTEFTPPVNSVDTEPTSEPSLEKEDAPIVASEKERAPDEQRRGTRLPADWRACAACLDYAVGRGLDPGAIEEEFRDYWHAKDGPNARKRDWDATFRTWCRNAAGPRVNGHKASAVENLYLGAYRAAESYNRKHGLIDEGDLGASVSPALPLLDGGRSSRDSPSATRGLDRGSGGVWSGRSRDRLP